MMMRLRALQERVQRFVARASDFLGFGNALIVGNGRTATAIFAWDTQPCMADTAPSMHGNKYRRRLQELLT